MRFATGLLQNVIVSNIVVYISLNFQYFHFSSFPHNSGYKVKA